MSLRKLTVTLLSLVLGPPCQGWQASLFPPLKKEGFLCLPFSEMLQNSVLLGQGLQSCGCAANHHVLFIKQNITGGKRIDCVQ